MLHEDPSRRIPAEVALGSPFFSIPFGEQLAWVVPPIVGGEKVLEGYLMCYDTLTVLPPPH